MLGFARAIYGHPRARNSLKEDDTSTGSSRTRSTQELKPITKLKSIAENIVAQFVLLEEEIQQAFGLILQRMSLGV